MEQFAAYLEALCVRPGFVTANKYLIENEDKDKLAEELKKEAHAFYDEREQALTGMGVDMREFERVMLLSAVDRRWMDHIDAMDELRDGIGYRAYSGSNPVTEYQIEAGHMYEELNYLIREDTLRMVYQARVERTPERKAQAKAEEPQAEAQQAGGGVKQPRKVSVSDRIGRNDPCPCGSGLKYKNCCGKNKPQQ